MPLDSRFLDSGCATPVRSASYTVAPSRVRELNQAVSPTHQRTAAPSTASGPSRLARRWASAVRVVRFLFTVTKVATHRDPIRLPRHIRAELANRLCNEEKIERRLRLSMMTHTRQRDNRIHRIAHPAGVPLRPVADSLAPCRCSCASRCWAGELGPCAELLRSAATAFSRRQYTGFQTRRQRLAPAIKLAAHLGQSCSGLRPFTHALNCASVASACAASSANSTATPIQPPCSET